MMDIILCILGILAQYWGVGHNALCPYGLLGILTGWAGRDRAPTRL